MASAILRKAISQLRCLSTAVKPSSTNRRLCFSTCPRLLKKEVEEDMDELQRNAYYNKYADKIAKLQKTSPEEFLNRIATVEEKKKSKQQSDNVQDGRDFSLPSQPKKDVTRGSIPSMVKEKNLSDIMEIDLVADKTKEEIAEIWKTRHSQKNSLCAVIPADIYAQMSKRFEEFKTFLFPLPRKEGYEFFVVQFSDKEAHFTTLINFQAYAANAPECLTLVHYTDLMDDKGIVLMVGEYDKNLLDTQEAQCLANQVEMYYCNPSPEKLKLLANFAQKPDEFKYMELVQQLESISLLTEAAEPSAEQKKAE